MITRISNFQATRFPIFARDLYLDLSPTSVRLLRPTGQPAVRIVDDIPYYLDPDDTYPVLSPVPVLVLSPFLCLYYDNYESPDDLADGDD